MLSIGGNLLSNADLLKKVNIDYIYHCLKNPKPFILSHIRQLRIIREIDKKQYSQLKRKLPYIVCASFNPSFRRTENFAYTEYFILDIDHIKEKGKNINILREHIEKDNRIVLSFLSPGEDGLKLLFKLKERCYDAGIYSLFYKSFVKEFSKLYDIEQIIDERTSDVCRACFISIDGNAYYNPDALSIDLKTFIPDEDICFVFDLKHKIEKEQNLQTSKNQNMEEYSSKDPDKEVIDKIKMMLNNKKNIIEKIVYIPQQLDEIITDLIKYIQDTGIIVYEVKNIQYAKKIRLRLGIKEGEINLFYGKHGFNVVQSPRCGTSAELNQIASDLINSFLTTIS